MLIIVPGMALLVAQVSGALWLSASELGLVSLGLLVLRGLLALLSAVLFDRESILTKWRKTPLDTSDLTE